MNEEVAHLPSRLGNLTGDHGNGSHGVGLKGRPVVPVNTDMHSWEAGSWSCQVGTHSNHNNFYV